jgi:hypothetical protein
MTYGFELACYTLLFQPKRGVPHRNATKTMNISQQFETLIAEALERIRTTDPKGRMMAYSDDLTVVQTLSAAYMRYTDSHCTAVQEGFLDEVPEK